MEWREIPGTEGVYKVNENGDIINAKNGNKVTGSLRKDGFVQISAYINGDRETLIKHRCVALAFVENPNNYRFIKFKDGDKNNIHASNLMWVRGSNKKLGNNKRPVKMMDINHKIIKKYNSGVEAAKDNFMNPSTVSKACKTGKRALGYYWEYIY